MVRLKKGEEGIYEIFINLFLPLWLPFNAIKMMIGEMLEERRKKQEEEEKGI